MMFVRTDAVRTLRDVLLAIGALVLGPIHAGGFRLAEARRIRRRAACGARLLRLRGASGFLLGAMAGSAAGVVIAVVAGVSLGRDPVDAALALASGGVGTLAGGLVSILFRPGGRDDARDGCGGPRPGPMTG